MSNNSIQISLAGKVALITGSARGLGAEIAKTFSRAGATIMITDILEDLGKETVKQIEEAGGKAAFLPQNVTSEADWESVVADTVATFGGLDIVVNNAGIEI